MALIPPFSGQDLAEEVNNKLDKTGGEINGDVEVNGNLDVSGNIDVSEGVVTGVKPPVNDTDAASRRYVLDNRPKFAYGSVTYTDTLGANQTLVKEISVPSGAYKGTAVIRKGEKCGGMMLHFSKDNSTGLVSSLSQVSGMAVCYSVREIGKVAESHGYLQYVTGSFYIELLSFFIGSSNSIEVTFKNISADSKQLNCRIDWEVWY